MKCDACEDAIDPSERHVVIREINPDDAGALCGSCWTDLLRHHVIATTGQAVLQGLVGRLDRAVEDAHRV